MALGLGFNKAKILQTAEKYVLQGKLPAALDEYQKILKKDPKDLMTLNTVGDLYVRAGKIDEAVKCFYDLAEKSVEGGFVPRAIAVYKRITKIDVEALPALTKLGELYSMQGLMRDARTHYLQAVEIYMRRREPGKAREVFEKVLMLDMENPRLQRRMAELYAETGKKAEAVATYLSAAERFLDTKEAGEASNTLEILAKLEPDNLEARVIRGRVQLEQGDPAKAIETLNTIPIETAGKSALDTLFHAYRKLGNLERASDVARKMFDSHEDFAGLALVAHDLVGKGDAEGGLRILQGAAEKLQEQGASSVLIEGLQNVLKADSSNIVALELLWGVYRRTGDIGEGRETAELLAHAYVAAEQLAQARDVYAELVALEPDNADHVKLLRQVEARLGSSAAGTGSDESATAFMAMEAAIAPEDESTRVGTLPPREQAIVKNCLTESELYLTYHQLPKAIETLEKGLEEVPGDASLYEHLLQLYEQSQQYQKAAQCAEALTEIYVKMGDGDRSARYGELILNYQLKAQETVGTMMLEPPLEASAPNLEVDESPVAESQVREVDLSTEWASLSESGTPASAAENTAEEIEFYLQAGLATEAAAAIGRLRESSPDHASLRSFDDRLAVLMPGTTQFVEDAPAEALSEAVHDATPPDIFTVETPAGAITVNEPESQATAETVEASFGDSPSMMETLDAPQPAAVAESEPDLVLDDVFHAKGAGVSGAGFELSLEESPIADQAPAASARPTPPASAMDRFASLAGDLHGEVHAAGSAPAGLGVTPTPATAPGGGFLDDIFAEFKEDVGESSSAGDDDLETHYNMGVAFKEMALYDEAIGEFQKVHQLAESAKDYSHIVQCCSLLATCFLGKGMPELAVKWYQTAINSPGVDSESALALLYEKGSAQETAGDRPGALKSFKEVYARNIDYRNVADRIRDLQ